jgi:hypothetical protein
MPGKVNPDMHGELVALRAELARQQRVLATFQRTTARRARWSPVRWMVAALAVALLVALVPLGLLAAGPFTDLDPNSPHNGNIAAIQAAGITKGCDPPDFTQYCPKDNVTREEMASFLARTAGLGGNPPVAHALTAQTADTATNAINATNATNATNASNAKNADDADLFNGKPSSAYVQVTDIITRYAPTGLRTDYPPITISPEATFTGVKRNVAGSGSGVVYLPLDRLTGLGFMTYRIKSATICYNTPNGSGVRITGTRFRAVTETGGIFEIYNDTTTRPASAGFPNFTCYTVDLPNPGNVAGVNYLTLSLNFPNDTDDLLLGQVKVVLTPQSGISP